MNSKINRILFTLLAVNVLWFCYTYLLKKPSYSASNGIQFEFTSYNFGLLKPTDSADVKFKFTNVGKKVLEINGVLPQCSCTIANYSIKPIPPGQNDIIELKYDSRIIGMFRKDIVVSFKNIKEPIILQIKGEVRR